MPAATYTFELCDTCSPYGLRVGHFYNSMVAI